MHGLCSDLTSHKRHTGIAFASSLHHLLPLNSPLLALPTFFRLFSPCISSFAAFSSVSHPALLIVVQGIALIHCMEHHGVLRGPLSLQVPSGMNHVSVFEAPQVLHGGGCLY